MVGQRLVSRGEWMVASGLVRSDAIRRRDGFDMDAVVGRRRVVCLCFAVTTGKTPPWQQNGGDMAGQAPPYAQRM